MIQSDIKWYSFAVLGVFLWSFNVIVAVYLKGILLPWQIAFFRWAIAGFVLIPFTAKDIWTDRHLFFRHWKLILTLSFFGISLSNTFVYIAGYSISAIEMALIQVTGPLFLIIFSRLSNQIKLSQGQKIGLFLTVTGCILTILKGRLGQFGEITLKTGDFWMLMTAATFGYYSFLMSQKPPGLKQLPLLTVTVILGCLFTLPGFINDTINNPLTIKNITESSIIMLYMGIFNSVLAYICWNEALNHLSSIKVGMMYYLMPIFSTIEAYFILSEKIQVSQLLGGLLILIGIWLANRKMKLHMERP